MRVGQTLRVLTRPIILYPKCLNQTTSNQCNRKVELHLQWMLSKKAISQVLELLQSRTTYYIQPSEIALTDGLRDAIHDLQTANSQIRRNQLLKMLLRSGIDCIELIAIIIKLIVQVGPRSPIYTRSSTPFAYSYQPPRG